MSDCARSSLSLSAPGSRERATHSTAVRAVHARHGIRQHRGHGDGCAPREGADDLPSLGPTAFLFFYTPLAPAASPRNTVIGHAIGAAAGWVSLAALGLLDEGPALEVGVSWAYVLAASMALALTASLMALLDAPHPPAGATTLIVALGFLTEIDELLMLMAAVTLLTVQAFAINHAAGRPYPRWASHEAET